MSLRGSANGKLEMLGPLIGWAFGSLLYFKIAFDASFRPDITIFAALLLAILTTLAVFVASGIYAHKLLRFNWTPGAVPASVSDLVGPTIWPFLSITAVFVGAARLVIFGFSKRLSSHIDVFQGYRRNSFTDEIVVFSLICIAPLLVHYLMCISGTYMSANQNKPFKATRTDEKMPLSSRTWAEPAPTKERAPKFEDNKTPPLPAAKSPPAVRAATAPYVMAPFPAKGEQPTANPTPNPRQDRIVAEPIAEEGIDGGPILKAAWRYFIYLSLIAGALWGSLLFHQNYREINEYVKQSWIVQKILDYKPYTE